MFLDDVNELGTAGDPLQQRIMQLDAADVHVHHGAFAVGPPDLLDLVQRTQRSLQQYVMMRKFKVDNPDRQGLRPPDGQETPKGLFVTTVPDEAPFDRRPMEAARVLFAHEVSLA